MSLSGLETTLLSAFLLLLMLGMGATLSLENFAAVLRRPAPILIGLASQFGWMPLPAPMLYGVIVVPLSALAAALFRRSRL